MTTLRRRLNWLGLATIVVLVGIWELLVDVKIIDFTYLPAPTRIATRAGDMFMGSELWMNLEHTITATVIGWLIASFVGVTFGVILGRYRPVWTYSMSSIDALRSLPVVAFVPVAVIIFGFTLTTEVVVAAYSAVWPILLNTNAGIRGIHPRLLDVARTMHMGPLAQLWKLRIPAAATQIVTGLRLGLSVSLVLVLVAEMVGTPKGIGYALVTYSQALQPEKMFILIIVIGLAGIALNSILMALGRVVARGQMTAAGEQA